MNAVAQIVIAVGVMILLVAGATVVVRFARTIKVTIGGMAAEFKPNGGSSMRDSLDRVEAKVDGLIAQVQNHEARIKRLENPPKPRTPRKKAA